jgi:hypothetical protein
MVLALWSYGIVLAHSCGLTRVAATLADTFGEKEGNLRQRLREWYWDKADKQGKQRVDWQVSQSFRPLLKWILELWSSEEKLLALAMDATTLKDVFIVLSISVVYRGCAIPVAWAILPEWQKGSWKELWLSLFHNLQGAIPSEWQVLVMADRGLYAPWLYESVRECGWHPFFRINLGGKYCRKGEAIFKPMSQLLPTPGSVWSGQVTCFVRNSVHGTLLAGWSSQHKEPWLILTDLAPELASVTWYSLRCWIENGFKDLKRDGWQWQKTRMSDPARAARFWLALAVATLWVVSLGGEVDAYPPTPHWDHLPPTHVARRYPSRRSYIRSLSCFSRGLIAILNLLLGQRSLHLGRLIPEPLPLKTYP